MSGRGEKGVFEYDEERAVMNFVLENCALYIRKEDEP